MTTVQLDNCVKERFNVGLYEFMKDKVELESLYDYEVAGILNVDGAYVSRLRKAFGIKKANGFSRRFENAYGNGAVERFKKIIENPDNALVDVAGHFGFSREYARQVYRKIYGCPYTNAFQSKVIVRKRRKLDYKMSSRRFVSLTEAIERMKLFGFAPKMTDKGSASTFFVNGYKLVFRCTSKSILLGSNRYFRISHGDRSNGHCDFFICLCRNNGKSIYFVIPRHVMPKYGVCLLLDKGSRKSKYTKYKDAWHLLTPENHRNVVTPANTDSTLGAAQSSKKSGDRPGYVNSGSHLDPYNSPSAQLRAEINSRVYASG